MNPLMATPTYYRKGSLPPIDHAIVRATTREMRRSGPPLRPAKLRGFWLVDMFVVTLPRPYARGRIAFAKGFAEGLG
jgi:hypothetical protein